MTIVVHDLLEHLLAGSDLSEQQALELFQMVMTGGVDDAMLSAILICLRLKGETTSEITGAIRAMRALMTPVHTKKQNLIDTLLKYNAVVCDVITTYYFLVNATSTSGGGKVACQNLP